ncbi:Mannosylfructose-phosphate synthase [Oligella urethralis]|uniref:glycosyltransferase n=1 Tax=Oligella urethralis TaxID=90245 RepID=UPI000E036DC0|nr:glycosyltransferase [Oligella urethralis]SUA60541.1 Mannosylfructose-phosphate synthase [Oligella urethralis]
MHITLLIPSLVGGGAEKVAIYLANEFIRSGNSVDIVTLRLDHTTKLKLNSRIKIKCLKAKKMSLAVFEFSKFLKKKNTDIVLSFMTDSNIVAAISIMFLKRKPKLFLTKHSTYTKSENFFPKWLQLLAPYIVPVLYKRANKVICVTEGVAKDFQLRFNFPAESLEVIYNPLMAKEILDKSQKELEPQAILEKTIGKKIILAIGRLVPAKNFSLLINAFKELNAKQSSHLVILGEGYLRKELTEQIHNLGLNDNVDMPGFIDNPYPWFKVADLFVLSSDYEGFGLVLAEALICGVPILSTNCEHGPSEILDNGKLGMLVPCGDMKSLVTGMISQLHNPLDVDATEKIREFDPKSIAGRYLELFKENKLKNN